MTAPTRECLGCGGSGCTSGEHAQHYVTPEFWGCWCPACNGSGTQTDRRTAEQAMVDAEQFTWYTVYQGPVGTWDACGRDVEEAAMFANSWSAVLADGEGERTKAQIEYGLYAHAYESARKAARAAFRAVPALREE